MDTDYIELENVHLYGLEESYHRALCNRGSAIPIANSSTALIISRAYFVCGPQEANASGGHQTVISGRLFSEEWEELRGGYVLKLPKKGTVDEEDMAVQALESEKADALQAFGGVFPRPLGHAIAKVDDVWGDAQNVFCILQGRVDGKTLWQAFFDERGEVSEEKIRLFLDKREDAFWGLCPKNEHVPFVLVIKYVFLPIAYKISSLEDQGWQHNDISPGNIMWSDQLEDFRLIDVELTSRYSTDDYPVPSKGEGTRPYAPPMGLEAARYVTRGTDIRALSAICWQLLGFPLSGDVSDRMEQIKKASKPKAFGMAYLKKVAETVVEGTNGFPVSTLACLVNQVKEAEEVWRDELREILLNEGECGGIWARDAYERFKGAVGNLERNVKAELENSVDNANRTNSIVRAAIMTLAFCATAGVVIMFPSLGSLIVCAAKSSVFLALSTVIALAPVVLGILVDSPIAWLSFKKTNPQVKLDKRSFQLVAKYGSYDGIVRKAGRFDPTADHCVYFGLCNFAGMLCYISLLLSTMSIEGFAKFVTQDSLLRVVSFFVTVFSAFLAWKVVVDQQRMPQLIVQRCDRENPDIHLFTRVHVWANMFHLTWTFSWGITLCLALLAFCLSSGRTIACPPILIWPCLQLALFAIISGVSPRAQSIGAEALGSLLVIFPILAVVSLLLGFVLFLPSVASLFYLLIAALSIIVFMLVRRFLSGHKVISQEHDSSKEYETIVWMDRAKRNGWYTVTITLVIVALAIANLILGTTGF